MELKTFLKSDPEFRRYLSGTFSKTARALPMRSLNVGTDREEVVFKVLELREIALPPFFRRWAAIFKLHHLLWAMVPIFLILTKSWVDEDPIDLGLALASIAGVTALLIGGNLFNDYWDHMSGVDRVHPQSSDRALQQGWVTAQATRFWAFVFLIVGIVCGLPAIFARVELLPFVAISAAGILVYGVFSWRGFKYRWGTELAMFWLLGPLLAIGFQSAATGAWDLETFLIGWLMGWLLVFALHLKNFEHLLVNAQVGFSNTMAALGFERAKSVLEIWWVLFAVQFVIYHLSYTPSLWAWSSLIPALLSVKFLRRLRALATPAGSHITAVVAMGRLCLWSAVAVWLLSGLFYFLMVSP